MVGDLPGALAWALAWLQAAPLHLLGSPVTRAEGLGFVLSLGMVACNIRVNVWGWPLAIASSLLYALVFAGSRLYGEAALQGLFIAMAAWGWWQWLRGQGSGDAPGTGAALQVGRLTPHQARLAALATLAAWPLLGWVLQHGTNSDVPFLDAAPTVASVTGTLLLARKRIENWAVWLGVNVFSVGLFAYKALWLTALLYALFALLSVVGWRAWRRKLS